MRTIRSSTALAVITLASLFSANRAHAEDSFAARVAAATPVAHVDDLAWVLTAPCDQGDDVQQRQCRLLRDARASALSGGALAIEAEPSAFSVGTYDAAKKSVSLTLTGCIQCTGIAVGGKRWLLTGGAPRNDGGTVRGAVLFDSARSFNSSGAATTWIEAVAQAHVQLVVALPKQSARWQVAGKDGLALDVLAYRVLTPCNGNVVISSPASGPVAPDKAACKAPGKPATKPPTKPATKS